MRTERLVADRLASLASPPAKPDGTLAWAEGMLDAYLDQANGARTNCTVDRHCRTRIFDFPEATLAEPVPHITVYRSDRVCASLVCDLVDFFAQTGSRHYALSPPLRHAVAEKRVELKSKRESISPYVVIEQVNTFPPMLLDRACASLDEVVYRGGERTPLIHGGRDDGRFVLAFETSDGPWPGIPRDEQTVNMVLAAVRAYQDASDEIPKHVDQSCLLTNDDRYVCVMPAGYFSARLSSSRCLDGDGFRAVAGQLRDALPRIEADMGSGHVELLVNALYWDDYKDDDFRRLHYLRLWQSLSESRKKLGYRDPKVGLKDDSTVIAGTLSPQALTSYRDAIAHWWTGTMDGNYLVGIYRTVNELIRRNYFG